MHPLAALALLVAAAFAAPARAAAQPAVPLAAASRFEADDAGRTARSVVTTRPRRTLVSEHVVERDSAGGYAGEEIVNRFFHRAMGHGLLLEVEACWALAWEDRGRAHEWTVVRAFTEKEGRFGRLAWERELPGAGPVVLHDDYLQVSRSACCGRYPEHTLLDVRTGDVLLSYATGPLFLWLDGGDVLIVGVEAPSDAASDGGAAGQELRGTLALADGTGARDALLLRGPARPEGMPPPPVPEPHLCDAWGRPLFRRASADPLFLCLDEEAGVLVVPVRDGRFDFSNATLPEGFSLERGTEESR